MLVIVSPGHPLAVRTSVDVKELSRYDLISQFHRSDQDIKTIFWNAGIRPQTRYILDDDISVMGMVAQGEGVALMPEMMLRTASFDLCRLPLHPKQTRVIGLATPPLAETTLLVRTFAQFCKDQPF